MNDTNICSCVRKVKEINVWGTRYLRDPKGYGFTHTDPMEAYKDVRLLFSEAFANEKGNIRGDETAKIIYEDGSTELATARMAWAKLLISIDCEKIGFDDTGEKQYLESQEERVRNWDRQNIQW